MTMAVRLVDGRDDELRWQKVTDRAAWQPRDSQGEVVFDGKMWILGGWFSSLLPAPRDVWSSADGVNWSLVTPAAGWRSSDIPMTLVFKNRMWFMGGWYNGRLPDHAATNEVWSSADGREWALAGHAGWSPRMGAGAVVFKDKMWILGGTEDYLFAPDDRSLKNDVWCSADGKNWQCVAKQAAWAPRALHQALVFKDRIWVLGGGNYVPGFQVRNDVWCSEDGEKWTEVVKEAPWEPRIWFSATVYRDRMWVLGGSTLGNRLISSVWYSPDGKEWTELKCDVSWSPRHEHSVFVFQDKLWVAGGYDPVTLNSEVWSLYIPEGWFEGRRESLDKPTKPPER